MTVGVNCCWSPTIISCRQPCIKGTCGARKGAVGVSGKAVPLHHLNDRAVASWRGYQCKILRKYGRARAVVLRTPFTATLMRACECTTSRVRCNTIPGGWARCTCWLRPLRPSQSALGANRRCPKRHLRAPRARPPRTSTPPRQRRAKWRPWIAAARRLRRGWHRQPQCCYCCC